MQLKTRLGREPWSTKRLKELIIKRLWAWIQSPNTGCKFFTLICCKICIVYVKRPKIKENETKDVPFLKTKMLLRKHFLLFTVCLPFSIWVRQVTLKRLIINKVIFCSRAEDAVVSASKGNTFLQKKLIVAGFFVPTVAQNIIHLAQFEADTAQRFENREGSENTLKVLAGLQRTCRYWQQK